MILPPDAIPHAQALLSAMQSLAAPTEAQRRFIGTLRKAMGHVSNNERHKGKRP